jgi:basic membrane protein A
MVFSSCKKEEWKPGRPIAKETIKIGVVHISDPFTESSGYAYAHQLGIEEMKQKLGLADNQLLYKNNVDDVDSLSIENSLRELVALGANIIFATSWGYMDICEKLALEFPSVVFAHASGYKYNSTNFTNYFGRSYQAKYLSGIVAGTMTKTGKIGFVAPWGKENSEVSCNLNAFAIGVESVNPDARIYIKITNSWFDPMGESAAARALIAEGCDIISQDVDSPTPQIEAERAGVWGIGYNTDMAVDAPATVLTSVLWHWEAYYTALVQSVINGTFTTTPYFGSLKDGIVGLAPLNRNIGWSDEIISLLNEERRRIESGAFDVFYGIFATNDGRSIGKLGGHLSDEEVHSGINWHYHTVIEQ